ncbi:LysM peptidoglycan-binding domain-containing protein [Ligilactobacillus agilis]|uniref:aggregation-promoting factor n=1 Tax=Ligilactobacillus agilis TaxID=1601 RepID=UPI00195CDAB9|nr:LysM domain-containing protein [Ligilactobacillus agilis]MBM6763869.1 LysM peptidoglycan-binding domain-containing protein [Ligilactobacillus agilis]MBM6773784.1 LysM peptidoglycan-binding domain-containing protein [Ligilactobacillus agilis]UNL41847.1 LysM peptidoglycan-binding domain-containing protein [Ligilactobacillus agilis]UNL58940.1 LysM peptidoglycan-binding domain-containing protein [Ligilactobacillus agilis]
MKLNKLLLSATAAAGFFAATTAVANADTVTVQAGDTVSEIADKYNTTVEEIQNLNQLENVNLIYVGEELVVNTNGQAATTASSEAPAATATVSSQAPVQQAPAQPVAQQAPAQQQVASAPAQQATSQQTYTAPAAASADEASAREFIAARESGGSYSAANGQYYGKYQLSRSYLGGDLSAANQERVANNYVQSRYGSWTAAKNHWLQNGWY